MSKRRSRSGKSSRKKTAEETMLAALEAELSTEREATERVRQEEKRRIREQARSAKESVSAPEIDVEESFDNYDEDDFEDYDEDFEDEEESKDMNDSPDLSAKSHKEIEQKDNSESNLQQIENAMHIENKIAKQDQLGMRLFGNTSKFPANKNISIGARRMDGLSPTNGTGKNNKTNERIAEIKTSVTFTDDTYQIFDLPPINQSDLYLRSVQSSQIKLGSSQTNDDARGVRIQTDPQNVASKQVQVPDDLGINSITSSSMNHMKKKNFSFENLSFCTMLRRASKTIEVLLEENIAASSSHQSTKCMKGSGFSAGCIKLNDDKNSITNTDTKTSSMNDDKNSITNTDTKTSSMETKETKETVSTKDSLYVELFANNYRTLLKDRKISAISFSYSNAGIMMTSHLPKNNKKEAQCISKEELSHNNVTVTEAMIYLSKLCTSIICIWNVGVHTGPVKVLLCNGYVTCCHFSPKNTDSSVVFAGTEEGTLSLWDLRETSSMHASNVSAAIGLQSGLRFPTYSTSNILCASHDSAVVRIAVLQPYAVSEPEGLSYLLTSEEPHGEKTKFPETDVTSTKQRATEQIKRKSRRNVNNISFQIASLDDRGGFTIWSIVPATISLATSSTSKTQSSSKAVSGLDPCLTLGGKIKLIRTATIYCLSPLSKHLSSDSTSLGIGMGLGIAGDELGAPGLSIGPICTDFCFQPSDPSQYLVTTTRGKVLRFSRFGDGQKEPPSEYFRGDIGSAGATSSTQLGFSLGNSAATKVVFSPFLPSHFLVGYSDGDIALYNIHHSTALMTWRGEERIKLRSKKDRNSGKIVVQDTNILKIVWSPLRASVFYVLDTSSHLMVWDLLVNSDRPVTYEDLRETIKTCGYDEKKHISGHIIDIAHSASGVPRTRKPSLACVDSQGNIFIHDLPSSLEAQSTYDDDGLFVTLGDEATRVIKILSLCPLPVYDEDIFMRYDGETKKGK